MYWKRTKDGIEVTVSDEEIVEALYDVPSSERTAEMIKNVTDVLAIKKIEEAESKESSPGLIKLKHGF